MAYNKRPNKREDNGFSSYVAQGRRVARKNTGGTIISFASIVIIGNKLGKVGYSMGKSPSMRNAIQKAEKGAQKKMITCKIVNGTIPHDFTIKRGASKIMFKPAPPGSGIIAGGVVRKILELAGYKDISAKVFGTNTISKNVQTTFEALEIISKSKVEVKEFKKKEKKATDKKEDSKKSKVKKETVKKATDSKTKASTVKKAKKTTTKKAVASKVTKKNVK